MYASILTCVKDQEENLEAEKASKYVISSERYYVQRRDTHEFLVRELASPEEEPCEEDRIVRVFPNPESAYHFADAANAMQRKLDTHTGTSWSVRAV